VHRKIVRKQPLAAFFLLCKGYHILGLNRRTPFGEVDILARHKHDLVVVEVKMREGELSAYSAISQQQRQRLTAAAQCLAARFTPHPENIRLDAVLFKGFSLWPHHIKAI
jgi:putative endonuclease